MLCFSFSFVLKIEPTAMSTSISRQVFSFLSSNTLSGRFVSIVHSVIIGISHIIMVPLKLMTLSSIRSW